MSNLFTFSFFSASFHALSLLDWVAFLCCWPALALYTSLSDRHGIEAECLQGASRRARMSWAVSAAKRPISGRMVDASILGTLNNSAVFFASSALLALGAFLSLTISPDRMKDAIDAIGVAGLASRDMHLIAVKAAVAGGFFGWAFLKFSWSMRQIAFAASMCGSFGEHGVDPEEEAPKIEAFADLSSLAGESFNTGLRSFYWSMAACCWLLSPWLCIVCSASLAFGLWRREFRSETLRSLQKAHPPIPKAKLLSMDGGAGHFMWAGKKSSTVYAAEEERAPHTQSAQSLEVAARDN
jgi:uncharacterized membrane protein